MHHVDISGIPHMASESSTCADRVCMIVYTQNSLGGEQDDIGFTGQLVDASGDAWGEVKALVAAQPLEVQLPPFVPSFGKTVSLTLPAAYVDQSTLCNAAVMKAPISL